MKLNPLVSATVIVVCLLCPRLVSAQDAPVNKDGKILGTGGVSSVSGAGGGGLIPWATLSSYADAGQRGGSLFRTRVDVDAYQLDIDGGALTFGNRIELSFARQNLLVKPANLHVRQDKTGIKVRVLGDIIFDKAPQITLGAERGSLRDKGLARAVGAQHSSGTDYTISFARAWLNGIAQRTTLLNVNVRYGNANQFGLLGYGGDDQDVKWTAEFAAAVFLTRQLVVGMEYRQKPDNLWALREDNAHDLFLAYFPDKRVSLTAAWVDLGEIAGARDQQGIYLSAQVTF